MILALWTPGQNKIISSFPNPQMAPSRMTMTWTAWTKASTLSMNLHPHTDQGFSSQAVPYCHCMMDWAHSLHQGHLFKSSYGTLRIVIRENDPTSPGTIGDGLACRGELMLSKIMMPRAWKPKQGRESRIGGWNSPGYCRMRSRGRPGGEERVQYAGEPR